MPQLTGGQKARLGIFVAVGLGLTALCVFLLAARAMLTTRDPYTIRFQDKDLSFSGLEVGSSVKYSGLKVGRVEGVRVAPEDVSVILVDITLDHGTPVAEDSSASLGSVGITGLKFVELSRGSPDARVREVGEEIPAGPSRMDELSARALDISAQLQKILVNIEAMTAGENQERVARLLDSSVALMEKNQASIQAITTNLEQTSQSALGVTEQTAALIAEVRQSREELHTVLLETQAVMGQEGVAGTVTRTNELLDQFKLLVRRNEVSLDRSLRDLQSSAENLFDLTQNLRDNPSLLVRKSKAAGDDLVR